MSRKRSEKSAKPSSSQRKNSQRISESINDLIYPDFSKKSAIGRANNKKGKEYERTVAQKLRKIWPKAARSIGQSRQGHENPDVTGTPFWVETSKGTTVSAIAKLKQAMLARDMTKTEQYKDAICAVFLKHQATGQDIVVMDQKEWLDMMLNIDTILENFQ